MPTGNVENGGRPCGEGIRNRRPAGEPNLQLRNPTPHAREPPLPAHQPTRWVREPNPGT
ncbi:hypothetical protein Amsp01_003610 [Amycolatopsis sp. NBRC 101858]|nr:hypothetical protein Amsp01_003610 [Amycolatopsis sp. NBRC 101858]